MKPFLYFVADRESSFRGGENNVNQATYVAVRHAFSRPFGTVPLGCSVPRTDVLGYSQPSLRDCFGWVIAVPRTDVLGYSQPILSKLDFLDQQAWTAFAENKSALKADREPVP